MSKAHIHTEGFEYIEAMHSVTPEQFAEKFAIDLNSARGWLSKWKTKGYLEYVPPEGFTGHKNRGRPSGGAYKIGKKSWIDIYSDNNMF
jgi:predicted ArsR family transcriptional regulator